MAEEQPACEQCGGAIPPSSPSEFFCRPACQSIWQSKGLALLPPSKPIPGPFHAHRIAE